jgi:glutathione S-transferase
MKLFYTPAACSLSPHIVAREAGFNPELVLVDLQTKKTKDGQDFLKVSPNGYVPALQLDSGEILTEGPAIVQYLADQKPDAKLAPPNGTLPRYQLQSWLNFITSELHKSFSPLFNPATPEQVRGTTIERISQRFNYVANALEGKQFLTGDQFTIADAYLFTVLNWTNFVKIDLGNWPALKAYVARVAARPAVQAAMKAEGLLK